MFYPENIVFVIFTGSPNALIAILMQDAVTCLLWLANSRYIATGCVDGKLRIWDSLSGECLKVLSGHSDAIQSIAASSNGDFLVSVSVDGTARVFEIAEFR